MKNRRRLRFFDIGVAWILCVVIAQPIPWAQAHTGVDQSVTDWAAPVPAQPVRAGIPQIVHGVTVTLAELRSRSQAAQPTLSRPAAPAAPRRTLGGRLGSGPVSPAGQPDQGGGFQPIGPDLPQTAVDEIIGPNLLDSNLWPPDTMGAVGAIDFLFTVNRRFRGFLKNPPHTQVMNVTDVAFWGSYADPAGVADPHVRYDRATQRWFITEIDTPANNNHILLAVSSGPDLSTATWMQFALPTTGSSAPTDYNCFAEYDAPGLDQNAIYIGARIWGGGAAPCAGGNYQHANLYVVPKGLLLKGLVYLTSFYDVIASTYGNETIQGVDSFDALPTGYAVAVDETESPAAHLDVWQINNPGQLTPATLSSMMTVTIPAENGSMGGVLTANNLATLGTPRPMDDQDDRLFSAVIRDGHLWTAHNVAVNASGQSNSGLRDRDAVRWYDVNVSGLTLNQSGTVFDAAASGFQNYWMGTLMVSGQGHVALGLNRANSTTNVEAGAVGRLAGTPLGTMLGFTRFQTSTADAYDDPGGGLVNRWGDYTYTSLDPCDDMTMWTTQEYVAGSFGGSDWGVAAAKLLAPPPATPSGAAPTTVLRGQASVGIVVTGTSVNGSGFYDTPNSLTDPCRRRLTAAVSGNVTVTSVSYIDPLHVQLRVATTGSALGPQTVTITNPDGQAASAALIRVDQAVYLPLAMR